MKKRSIWSNPYFVYTIIFSLFFTFILSIFTIHGKTLVHDADGLTQFYTVFIYIGRWLRGLINGSSHLYDFSIGFGENVIGSLNYYGFGDPLNIIAIFSTVQNAAFVFGLSIILRLYLSGLFMCLFLKKSDCREYSLSAIVIASLFYVFSIYALKYGTWFYCFLNMQMYLPVTYLCIDKILLSKNTNAKWYAFFSVVIAIVSCCSFYYLFMITIMDVIFVVICIIGTKPQTRSVVYGLISYVVGLLFSAPILFQAVGSFLNSSRDINNTIPWQLFFSLGEYKKMIANIMIPLIGNYDYSLGIIPIGIFALIVCLYSKPNKTLFALIIVGSALYICPAAWRMFNGFSYESNRWLYFLYFIISWAIAEFIDAEKSHAILKSSLLVCIFLVLFHYITERDLIRSFSYLIITILTFITCAKYKKKVLHIGLLSMFSMIFFICTTWHVGGQSLFESYLSQDDIAEYTTQAQVYAKEETARNESSKDNMSLINGSLGSSEYLSILNGNIADFYMEYFISSGINIAKFDLSGFDDRKSVKSLIGEVTANGKMGKLFTCAISYEAFSKLTPAERQVALAKCLITDNGKSIDGNLSASDFIDYKKCDFVSEEDLYTIKIQNKESGLYVLLKDVVCDYPDFILLNINGKKIYISGKNCVQYSGQEDYLVYLGDDEKTDVITISQETEGLLEISDIEVFSLSGITLDNNNEGLQLSKMSDTAIKGTINCDTEYYLFLPIPYSKGWTAKVDNVNSQIYKTDFGFSSILLPPGKHDVAISYVPYLFCIGIVVSAVSILLYIAVLFANKVKTNTVQ